MDRQALLEQKRQRLQELKQRRSELQKSSTVSQVPSLPVLVKVDFAVQVDPPAVNTLQTAPTSDIRPNEHRSDVKRFDKAVQTEFEEDSDIEEIPSPPSTKENIKEENELDPVETTGLTPQELVEEALEDQLEQSKLGFSFSNLRLGVKDPGTVQEDTKEPFNVANGLTHFLDRPITHISTVIQFPELILVGYGRSKEKKLDDISGSAGLAVIFNRNAFPMVPEFFLQCTSPITAIDFNTTDPFKIVAGLENGRVVMWDLTEVNPTQIAVLPTLQTTTLAASTNTSNHRYIHHTSPIVRIHQLDANSQLSSSIVSVSSEGILNLWSPNFLAFPKVDSVRLSGESERLKDQFSLTDSLFLLSHVRFTDEVHLAKSPEMRFLNQALVSSKNGYIYRLSSNKDKNCIASEYSVIEDQSPQVSLSVTSMAELPVTSTISIIVSGHNDWQLRVWDLAKKEPIASIPTATVVTKIVARPGHPFHIITLGSVNPPKIGPCIQFWDLQARLMSPVSTFSIIDKTCQATTACFTPDGSHVMVAFADGDINIWEIEESRLDAITSITANVSIDEGIVPLLKSV